MILYKYILTMLEDFINVFLHCKKNIDIHVVIPIVWRQLTRYRLSR